MVLQTHRSESWGGKRQEKHVDVLFRSILANNVWDNSCTSPVFGHTSQNHVSAVLIYSRHWNNRRTTQNQVGLKMPENACTCSCSGLFRPKSLGIIHAQVPFLATQARIRYRQFLYIAGNGIADAQARIMGEGKGKKKHVAVLVSVYSDQKDLE